MELPSEDLVKDVWSQMWEVQTFARQDHIPGPLRDFGKIANRQFETWLWFTRPGALKEFARRVLSGPSDLRATISQLPEATLVGDSFLFWKPYEMDGKLASIYYNPRGYWRGLAAVKKLSAAAKVTEAVARDFLKRQAVWQIYLPAPRHIPRPMFDEDRPNAVHQADLLYLPHDRVGHKTFKYALTVVDVASRYKEAEPLTDKSAAEVAAALGRIYKRGTLTWPRLLQVDPGREFMGAVNQLLAKHSVQVRRGAADNHRQQGIVERFNRTLAERLFGHQYAQEMLLAARGSSERSAEWVRSLPEVVAALNDEPTRLTGKKPAEAIKAVSVAQKPSSVVAGRPVGLEEPLISSSALVRYLYQPGELEGGRRRATDPVWSLTIHTVRNVVRQTGQPALYYLNGGPRCFVREELLIVPPGTELPPDRVLT
jgi:hypothetical protein